MQQSTVRRWTACWFFLPVSSAASEQYVRRLLPPPPPTSSVRFDRRKFTACYVPGKTAAWKYGPKIWTPQLVKITADVFEVVSFLVLPAADEL